MPLVFRVASIRFKGVVTEEAWSISGTAHLPFLKTDLTFKENQFTSLEATGDYMHSVGFGHIHVLIRLDGLSKSLSIIFTINTQNQRMPLGLSLRKLYLVD